LSPARERRRKACPPHLAVAGTAHGRPRAPRSTRSWLGSTSFPLRRFFFCMVVRVSKLLQVSRTLFEVGRSCLVQSLPARVGLSRRAFMLGRGERAETRRLQADSF
jgi:hypothetical protein